MKLISVYFMKKLTHLWIPAMWGAQSHQYRSRHNVRAASTNNLMRISILAIILASAVTLSAQDYSFFRTTLQSLHSLSTISDTTARKNQLNTLWSSLQEAHQIPLIAEDSVAFLYR